MSVEKNSVGEELGLKSGDEIIEFDGHRAVDILDYEYYDSLEEFSLTAKSGGEVITFDIEKLESETLGLELEREIKVRACRNKCIFCFIDQLPKENARKTLTVKDDDYRHSFISGTYITLTNLSEEDIKRIIRLKLSPLYISVHTTDEILRQKMLGLPGPVPLMPVLKRLHGNGIILHTQIVYCPGINEDLEKSINELQPIAATLSIVPVGLTRLKNPEIKAVTKNDAKKVVEIVEECQKTFLKEGKHRFVFAADEFYLKADKKAPHYNEYESFDQIENGVGLLAAFNRDFDDAVLNASGKIDEISIATGVSAYSFIKEKAKALTDKFGGKIEVYEIKNEHFGETVTVAGLVTGKDIYSQLKDKPLYSKLLIPSVMLREFNDTFLDGMTVNELSKCLNVMVQTVLPDGESFVNAIVLNNKGAEN